jgi:hypothetical protein
MALPGIACRLTGRNATGRLAASLCATPGTIARRARPETMAGFPNRFTAAAGRLPTGDTASAASESPRATADRLAAGRGVVPCRAAGMLPLLAAGLLPVMAGPAW